jgi:hypothetical protein
VEYFHLATPAEVLPEPVLWFWEAVEEGEIPFAYLEEAGPRLDSHPVGEVDLEWVISPDPVRRARFLIAVLVVDHGR